MNPNIEIKNEEICSPIESGSPSIGEINHKLMLEKQKYKLLKTELDLSKLIASKEIDKLKRENEHLKYNVSRLEEDCNILKLKEAKDDEMLKQYLGKMENSEKEFVGKMIELKTRNWDLDLALQAYKKKCESLLEDNSKLKRKEREDGDEEGMTSTQQIGKKKPDDQGRNTADTSLNPSISVGQTNTETNEIQLNGSHVLTLQANTKKHQSLKRKEREDQDEEGMILTHQIKKKKREDGDENAVDTSLNSSISVGQTNTEANEIRLNDSHIPTLQAYKEKCESLLEDNNKVKRKEREDGDEEGITSAQQIRKKKREDQVRNAVPNTSLNSSIDVGQTNTKANEIHSNESHIPTPAEDNDEKSSEGHRLQKMEMDHASSKRAKNPYKAKCGIFIDRVQITRTRSSRRRYTRRIASLKQLKSALKRANALLEKMGNGNHAFIKPMTKSNVSSCFLLGLPLKFSKENLSHVNEQLIVILEDEDGLEYESNCINKPRHCRLSSGWRSFVVDHNLEIGDVLVFELCEPTRFKVYIVKAKPGRKKTLGQKRT